MSKPPFEPGLPPTWMEELAKVQTAIQGILEETLRREQAWEGQAGSDPVAPGFSLAALEAPFHQFQARVSLTDREAAEADARLQACEQAVQDWLAAAAQVRGQLARTEAGEV